MNIKHTVKMVGEKKQVEVKDSCNFSKFNTCSIKDDMRCEYGLTQIYVPKECPLRNGTVVVEVRLVS